MRSSVSYISAAQAAAIDAELLRYFRIEQLMEPAGVVVAGATVDVFWRRPNLRTVVLCGPGNNGGDGLVAARHLAQWGAYAPLHVVVRGGPRASGHYGALLEQLNECGVWCGEDIGAEWFVEEKAWCGSGERRCGCQPTLIVDALFGLSFRAGEGGAGPPVREPYGTWIRKVNAWKRRCPGTVRILAVDIPSGWNVDEGVPNEGTTDSDRPTEDAPREAWWMEQADVLVSLTLPKRGVRSFSRGALRGGKFCTPLDGGGT